MSVQDREFVVAVLKIIKKMIIEKDPKVLEYIDICLKELKGL